MATPVADMLPAIWQMAANPLAERAGDGALLARFVDARNETAFAAIVARHGPLVLDVCRGVLGNRTDAEDAFQATFLVLAAKARTIRKAASLAAWLHGVAYRVALRARSARIRREVVEAAARQSEFAAAEDTTWAEVQRVIHDELAQLPDRFRGPLVLCYLRGVTQDNAASQLNLSKGTLKRRLETGRARLRERLIRRGLGPAALLLGAAWPGASANAVVPPTLTMTTLEHAIHYPAAAGMVPAKVAALATGVLKTMRIAHLKLVSAAVVLGGILLIGGGIGLGHLANAGQSKGDASEQNVAAEKEIPNLPNSGEKPTPEPDADVAHWSKPVNGLQVRVVLVEKPKLNGTRLIYPYLELRNASSSAYPLKVRCSGSYVKFEMVDLYGKLVDGVMLARSGPHADPGTVSLPVDSTLRVGMHCTNWGVPKDRAAMIATDSGAWVLKPEQKGKVFLRAVVSGGKKLQDETDNLWFGNVSTPSVKIDWDDVSVNAVNDIPEGPGDAKLREQLKSGTPRAKSAALTTILDSKALQFIPDVIAAIEDPTSLPREGDTGWGFVGHQAATVVGTLARSIDGIEVGMQQGMRPYKMYSFHNDQSDGGEKLQKSGRLAEVRKNWADWWSKLKLMPAIMMPGPRQPGGALTEYLGTYLTIEGEGVRIEGGKVETGTLLVDTVNGKKLDKPIAVLVRGLEYKTQTLRAVDLPAKRCVLKGYESGEMIGFPSGLLEAAKEQGRTDIQLSQAVWRWRPYFIARIAVEPKGLELPR